MAVFNAVATRASIVAAIDSACAASGNDHLVKIAAGTVTDWTTTYQKAIPKRLTIQGAGAQYPTAGGAALDPAGTDRTIILDRTSSSPMLILYPSASGNYLRMTGICVQHDTSSGVKNGWAIQVGGPTGVHSVRLDHCHFKNSRADALPAIMTYGDGFRGLMDHIYFDNDGDLDMGFLWEGDFETWGDQYWSEPDYYGTDKFVFMEDCRFRNGYSWDFNGGGLRLCFRHNTHVGVHLKVANHGLMPDRRRGSRCVEMYSNTIASSGNSDIYMPLNSGTGLYYNNTVSGFTGGFIDTGYHRNQLTSSWGNYSDPPTSWGYCNGTVGSVWDNGSAGAYYPAFGQPGRGQGDFLSGSGSAVSTVVNTARGNQRLWARELLSPIYVWGNSLASCPGLVDTWNAALFSANRDFYRQFGTYGETGSFDGTKGVGQGSLTLAQLQSAFPASGATSGVAYWSTTDNKLYVVSSQTTGSTYYDPGAKSWLTYYTPYVYPHPLQGEFPIAAASNGRYLQTVQGTPFLMIGDSAQGMSISLTLADMGTYMDARVAQGFNTINVNLIDTARGPNAPLTRQGYAPFTGCSAWSYANAQYATAASNTAYWALMDDMIDLAASKGLLITLSPQYLGYAGETSGWWAALTNSYNTQAVCTAFGQWLGNRYKTKTNLLWVIGGDQFPSTQEGITRLKCIMDGIISTGAPGLWAGDWDAPCLSTSQATFAPSMTANAVYTYGPNKDTKTYVTARQGWNDATHGTIPAYLKETGYEGETLIGSGTAAEVRRYQWWAVLSGCIAGLEYGHRDIYPFNAADWKIGRFPGEQNWDVSVNATGAVQMQYMATFLRSYQWWKLVPSELSGMRRLIPSANGTQSGSPSTYVAAAQASDGSFLMAYTPQAQTFTVDCRSMLGPSRGRWWNPTTGTYANVTDGTYSIANTESAYSVTASGDRVLVLDAMAGVSPPTGAIDLSAR